MLGHPKRWPMRCLLSPRCVEAARAAVGPSQDRGLARLSAAGTHQVRPSIRAATCVMLRGLDRQMKAPLSRDSSTSADSA